LTIPGAVVSTSNKLDVVDGMSSVPAQVALVWVFNPQKIAQEEPTWWLVLSHHRVSQVIALSMTSVGVCETVSRWEQRMMVRRVAP
jgi:hypothetical protein